MKIQTGNGTIPLITLIGIWSISALNALPGLAVSPILGKLSVVFPSSSELDIQMLSSLPSLLIIPFIILSGKLTEKVNNIFLLQLGLAIFSLSGILYLLSNKMWQLIAISALLGVGSGLIVPLSTGLISRFFTGSYRTKQFGYSSAITNITLVLATTLTGYLAEVNWHLPFLVYLFPLISIVLSFYLKKNINPLPGDTSMQSARNPGARSLNDTAGSTGTAKPASGVSAAPLRKTPAAKTDASIPAEQAYSDSDSHKGNGIHVKHLIELMLFYGLATYLVIIISFNLPFLMKEYHFTSGNSGIMISLFFLAIMAPGLFLNKIVSAFKNKTKFFSLVFIAVGMFLIILSPTEWLIGPGCILAGLGYGIIQPVIYDNTTHVAVPRKVTFALAFVMAMNYLAILLCPFIIDLAGNIFHNHTQQFAFIFNMIIAAAAAVWAYIRRETFLFSERT